MKIRLMVFFGLAFLGLSGAEGVKKFNAYPGCNEMGVYLLPSDSSIKRPLVTINVWQEKLETIAKIYFDLYGISGQTTFLTKSFIYIIKSINKSIEVTKWYRDGSSKLLDNALTLKCPSDKCDYCLYFLDKESCCDSASPCYQLIDYVCQYNIPSVIHIFQQGDTTANDYAQKILKNLKTILKDEDVVVQQWDSDIINYKWLLNKAIPINNNFLISMQLHLPSENSFMTIMFRNFLMVKQCQGINFIYKISFNGDNVEVIGIPIHGAQTRQNCSLQDLQKLPIENCFLIEYRLDSKYFDFFWAEEFKVLFKLLIQRTCDKNIPTLIHYVPRTKDNKLEQYIKEVVNDITVTSEQDNHPIHVQELELYQKQEPGNFQKQQLNSQNNVFTSTQKFLSLCFVVGGIGLLIAFLCRR